MPNIVGSLLRKKRTRDKEEGKDNSPTSPVTPGTPGSPLTTSSSNLSKTTSTPREQPHPPTHEANPALEQAPTQAHPTDPNETHHDDVLNPPDSSTSRVTNMQGVTAANNGVPMQPPMSTGKPHQNGHSSGMRPMADGSFPIVRDAKATKGKYSLGDFDFKRTLGTGSFGRVHLVKSKHNARFYAIKVLKKAQVVKMKQVEHTNDERKMLAKVKHPFLITLWGTFHDSKNLYMVMDFVEGGELFSLLRKSQVSSSMLWYSLCDHLRCNLEVPKSSR